MGLLVDGQWHDRWYDTEKNDGRFVRSESQFRNWVTADGSAGPSGQAGFKAEPGRYHLYVSLACPWAHRTLIFRQLKGLQSMISVDVVDALMAEQGWTLAGSEAGATGDRVNAKQYLHEVYSLADPGYTGRVTVPVLWDKKTGTIVSNESSEIIRMLNSAFDHLGAAEGDYYPEALRSEIDTVNGWIYDAVNNGVYRAGFASSQQAYDEAVEVLFSALDQLEQRLAAHRYLLGNRLTEADWRLFTTLLRFDPVYVTHFKCDRKRISDYPNLFGYLKDLYQVPGIAGTVNMKHIREHYYRSHRMINPTGILSVGPQQDLTEAHQRHRFDHPETP
ncbi:glutathione S-transferase family protein [Marinobacterium jannaschii]|uniref:glutathione S-transferase family protein n=1 Tax=Marinobacterium jannaschii TaxID=64970 RepID=UPI000481CF2B|nr:glutathione S-transferase family protein [Marinobacterium jannaschii]